MIRTIDQIKELFEFDDYNIFYNGSHALRKDYKCIIFDENTKTLTMNFTTGQIAINCNKDPLLAKEITKWFIRTLEDIDYKVRKARHDRETSNLRALKYILR